MKGRLILADYAEEHAGKLYLMGAGWTRILAGAPITMGLGIILSLTWDEAAAGPHKITLRLVKGGGDPVLDAASQPMRIEGTVDAGPRPGIEPTTVLSAPVAVRIPPTMLSAGQYAWHLEVDGDPTDTAEFEAIEGPL